MTPEPAHSPAAGPELLVRTPGAERSLPAGRSYYVGRDPQSDIVVNDSRVSWRHAVLRQDGASWLLEDVGSTNGTFQGRDRVQRIAISGSCAVRLGHPDDGPAMSCSVAAPPAAAARAGGPPTQYAQYAGGQAQAAAAPAAAPAGYQQAAPAGYQQAAPPQNPAVPRLAGPAPGGPAGAAGPGGPRYGGPGGPAQGTPGVPISRLSMERMPSAVLRLPTTLLRIGRAADNQVVVDDLSVSRYHAELRRDQRGGYSIFDLDSHNGTFVNGQRVGSAPVTERDIIGIGPATYRLVGEELQEFIDSGDITFIAQDLTVTLPSGKVLLDHMSFPLGERCLLGVIGPSGAGKSTLLGALTGFRPATTGSVLYDGRDLYMHYAELRHRIGLVPQENILHTQLTARRSLGYAAELRFPRDVSKAERNHRIDEVLGELALTKHAETRTAALSGGQQKRVNVALELLTKPSLLFLDEPTSGLDPGLDKSVMEQMADLAHGGRTVIVVTHSVDNLDLCDRLLVLVAGGKIGYFGAPKDGLRYFGKSRWADVFQAFEDEPDRDWATEFRHSVYYQQYIASGMEGAGAIQQHARPAPSVAPRSRNRLAQFSTLSRRYFAVITAEWGFLAAALVAPAVLGALFRLFPTPHGLLAGGRTGNPQATSLLLIFILSTCFIGGLFSVGEIVKERHIYARERAASLSAGAYLCSKLMVLGILGTIQAELLVLVGLSNRKFPPHGSLPSLPPLAEIAVAMALVVIASMALSLLISASVTTQEKTLPLFFLAFMLQIVMTGGVFPVYNQIGLKELAWFAPSRWGLGAAASTINLNVIAVPAGLPPTADPVWKHDAHTWLMDIAAMVLLFIGFSLLTWWRLLKQGPTRRK